MVKRYKLDEGFTTQELFYYAWGHLASAKILFDRSFDCYDSAGHLSHLGIELILKALLLHYVGSFPNEHNFFKLFTEIKNSDPSFELGLDHEKTLKRLNPYVSIRYPTPDNPIEVSGEDWNDIRNLLSALLSAMPSELKQEFLERNTTQKGGRILMKKPKDDVNRVQRGGIEKNPEDGPISKSHLI
jgi:HEPN domain-containing protein